MVIETLLSMFNKCVAQRQALSIPGFLFSSQYFTISLHWKHFCDELYVSYKIITIFCFVLYELMQYGLTQKKI